MEIPKKEKKIIIIKESIKKYISYVFMRILIEDNLVAEVEVLEINLTKVLPIPISKNLEYIKITKKSENKPYSSLGIIDKKTGNIKKQNIVNNDEPRILKKLLIFI